jgi:hypothetical protein
MKTLLLTHFLAFFIIAVLNVYSQDPLIPVVKMQDGRYIEGTVIESDSSFVLIAHPDNTMFTLPFSQIAHFDSIPMKKYVDELDGGKFVIYARRMQKLVEDDNGFFAEDYPNEICEIRYHKTLDTLIPIVYLSDGRYIEGSILSKDSSLALIRHPDNITFSIEAGLVARQDTIPGIQYEILLNNGKIYSFNDMTNKLEVDYYGYFGMILYNVHRHSEKESYSEKFEIRHSPYIFDMSRYIALELPYVVLKTTSNKYIEGLLIHTFRYNDFVIPGMYTGSYSPGGAADLIDSDDELLLSQSDECFFKIKRGMLTEFTDEDFHNYLEFVKSGKKWSYSPKSGEFILQDREYKSIDVTEDYLYRNNELIDEQGKFRDFLFRKYLKSGPEKAFIKNQQGQYITGKIVEQDEDRILINVHEELQMYKTSEISNFNYQDSVSYLKRSFFYECNAFGEMIDEENHSAKAGLVVLNVLIIGFSLAISFAFLLAAGMSN